MNMFKILIFSYLFVSLSYPFSIQEQNFVNISSQDVRVKLAATWDNVTLNRLQRDTAVRSRVEKPFDCAKLHKTEDTPFIAIILNRATGRLLCMGSIIDEKHILTANRCVMNTDHKTMRILLGYFKAWWGRHSYVYFVDRVLKHEHELVLLRLTRSITFSRSIRPIRLLREEDGENIPPTNQTLGSAKTGHSKAAAPGSSEKAPKSKQGSNDTNNKNGNKDKNKEKNNQSGKLEEHRSPKNSQINDGKTKSRAGSDVKEKSKEHNNQSRKPEEHVSPKKAQMDDGETNKSRAENDIQGKSKEKNKQSEKPEEHINPKNTQINDDQTKSKAENEQKEQVSEKQIEEGEEDEEVEGEDGDGEEVEEEEVEEEVEEEDTEGTKEHSEGMEEDPEGREKDSEKKEAVIDNTKINHPKKTYKIFRRDAENDAESLERQKKPAVIPPFMTKHKKIVEVLLVGFTVTRLDVMGDPIPQVLIYSMKEEKVEPGDKCVPMYHKLIDTNDDNKNNRDFCTPGTSKFCWGCLGGPTLFKVDNEFIQVGVIGGADCEKDEADKPAPYLHIRVDIHMPWILANSLIPQKL